MIYLIMIQVVLDSCASDRSEKMDILNTISASPVNL